MIIGPRPKWWATVICPDYCRAADRERKAIRVHFAGETKTIRRMFDNLGEDSLACRL
jgi:hypothetical protein